MVFPTFLNLTLNLAIRNSRSEPQSATSLVFADCIELLPLWLQRIEENNRMGKTRDLFKKIRDTNRTFHAKMGSIKDRNGMDLAEAADIKMRWQEYREQLYRKDLHDPDRHDGVITHVDQTSWSVKSSRPQEASL